MSDAFVIDKPGEYKTRDGRRVTVHEIGDHSTFCVKGSVWKIFRGSLRPRGYSIWTPVGEYRAIGQSSRDIVGPWE